MQVKVDIGFDQLLTFVKRLPIGQLRKLKAEIAKGDMLDNKRSIPAGWSLKEFLSLA